MINKEEIRLDGRGRWAYATSLSIAIALGMGCGEDSPGKGTNSDGNPSTGSDAGSSVDPCAELEDGAACGKDHHCLAGRCTLNVCGDGLSAGSEQCDDGNQTTGDGCTPSCVARPVTCGDLVVDAAEECDDGNWFNLDDCSNDCTSNVCGNAREDGAEECDDGNQVDTDACSNACAENRCRNGRLDPGEECDDGNAVHDDGCSNGCVEVVCGNGKTDDEARGGEEECDDGNQVNGDACSNTCTQNRCGNARVDPGEVCDGNTASKICSADCKQATANAGCEMCRDMNCRDYMGSGIDLVKTCVETADKPFRDQCTALVDCAKRNKCGYTSPGLFACFCGTVDAAACQAEGAADGPCREEVYAAARTRMLADVIGNFGDISLPVGSANFLVECEATLCTSQCAP